jgi:tetratricopeptide (TPR) repeat protein
MIKFITEQTNNKCILIFLLVLSLLFCYKEKEPSEFKDVEEILNIAEDYGEKGEIEKALLFAKHAYTIEPDNIKVKRQLSKVYATLGDKYLLQLDCDNAKSFSKKAIQLYYNNDGAINILSSCAMLEKDFNSCVNYSKREIQIDILNKNESGTPFHNLANCYMHLEKYDLAVNNFLEVLKRDPPKQNSSYYNNLYSLGRIYFIQGDKKNSENYLILFKSNYEMTDRSDLKKEYSIAYKEVERMLDVIHLGGKIGFPKGKEPAINDDVVSILKNLDK